MQRPFTVFLKDNRSGYVCIVHAECVEQIEEAGRSMLRGQGFSAIVEGALNLDMVSLPAPDPSGSDDDGVAMVTRPGKAYGGQGGVTLEEFRANLRQAFGNQVPAQADRMAGT